MKSNQLKKEQVNKNISICFYIFILLSIKTIGMLAGNHIITGYEPKKNGNKCRLLELVLSYF